jgi:hypothetical protein
MNKTTCNQGVSCEHSFDTVTNKCARCGMAAPVADDECHCIVPGECAICAPTTKCDACGDHECDADDGFCTPCRTETTNA